MKRIRRVSALFLSLLALVSALALPVAAQEAPDLTKPVSLTIHHVYQDESKPIALSGVEFSLYLVAKMGQGGALTPEPGFESYIIGNSAADWQKTLDMLQSNFPAGVTPTDKAKTDKNGDVTFTSGSGRIVPGLYYIQGTKTEKEGWVYTTLPFLVSLPNYFDGQWVYAQEANAKSGREGMETDITVIKVWKDSCHPKRRPESITVDLLCDGEKYDAITLPQNGKWKYTWKNLDATHEWNVKEARVKGYNDPVIVKDGKVFTITNTCNRPGPHGNTKLPQTGQLWWPVPVLLLAGLVLVILGLTRCREDNYEA